ncbi:MAG TPA: hypothetical protein VFN74_11565 [Chloroflexota bacterium]|nr:hypothetical protein [Chloroflexota bacterium]
MTQTNVNAGGTGGGTVYSDRSGTGFGMGMILSMLVGLLLLALVAWWAITQSGWFGPVGGSSTNVNVTTNTPSNTGTGSSGSTGSTTGGSTTGSTGSTTGSTAGR